MSTRTKLVFLVKLVIGLSLLVTLLVWDSNWQTVVSIARDSRLPWVAPFIGWSAILFWISSLKWGVFLKDQRHSISQTRLFTLYLTGQFFNNFFPSSVGGDVVRSYMLGRHIESQGWAMASVFLERMTGFVAMVTLAGAVFALSPSLHNELLVLVAILLMGAGCLGVVLVVLRPELVRWAGRPFRGWKLLTGLEEKIRRFHGYLMQCKERKGTLALAMIISYLFYAGAAVNVYLAARLLGVECDFLQVLVVSPIVMLIAALPLTPNSIGVWEWGFSVFLVFAGATPQEGLAIALALRVNSILFSLIGGVLFSLQGLKLKAIKKATGAPVKD